VSFQDARRAQGRPPVDDPWRAAAEFVISPGGLVRLRQNSAAAGALRVTLGDSSVPALLAFAAEAGAFAALGGQHAGVAGVGR